MCGVANRVTRSTNAGLGLNCQGAGCFGMRRRDDDEKVALVGDIHRIQSALHIGADGRGRQARDQHFKGDAQGVPLGPAERRDGALFGGSGVGGGLNVEIESP